MKENNGDYRPESTYRKISKPKKHLNIHSVKVKVMLLLQ